MLKHQSRMLQNDNQMLREQNANLEALVRDAQLKVKELSNNLQKSYVNVMPTITVDNEMNGKSSVTKKERGATGFALAGSVNLESAGKCVANGKYIAVGLENGKISLWSAQQPNFVQQNKPSKTQRQSSGLYRFSMDKSALAVEENNPLIRASPPFVGHHEAVTSINWDDDRLSSVSLDSTVKIWDINTAKYTTIALDKPAVGHTVVNEQLVIANCSESIQTTSFQEPIASTIEMPEIITSVKDTKLGLLFGTISGKILVMDQRMWRPFQTIQLSQAMLPISKISGYEKVTVTCFDGIVRVLGPELPLFVDRELTRAPMMGSIIGSCYVSLSARDSFIVSGSTSGRAHVWPRSGPSQTLHHRGAVVSDCAAISSFVGSFVTCDEAGFLSMWACSFNEPSPN